VKLAQLQMLLNEGDRQSPLDERECVRVGTMNKFRKRSREGCDTDGKGAKNIREKMWNLAGLSHWPHRNSVQLFGATILQGGNELIIVGASEVGKVETPLSSNNDLLALQLTPSDRLSMLRWQER